MPTPSLYQALSGSNTNQNQQPPAPAAPPSGGFAAGPDLPEAQSFQDGFNNFQGYSPNPAPSPSVSPTQQPVDPDKVPVSFLQFLMGKR